MAGLVASLGRRGTRHAFTGRSHRRRSLRQPGAGGTHSSDVIGTNIIDIAMSNAREELSASLQQVFDGGPVRSREARVNLPGLGERWFATSTGPLLVNQAVVAAVIIARDITDRKNSQAALEESEARYRTLVQFALEAIVVFDVDACRFVDANANASHLFGFTLDQLCETNPLALSPSHQADGRPSADAFQNYVEQALAGAAPVFAWVHRTSSGETISCDVRLVRMPAAERQLVRGSITDVTQQRRLEQQLLQWQRMDAIGQLAGGIAHDFMNVLTVILASAQAISKAVGHSALRVDATAIEDAAQRGAALASRLLTFARRESLPCDVPIDVNQVVRDVAVMVSRVLSQDIRLVQDLDYGNVPARVGRCQMEQVLMNLLINARDAIEITGTITIKTSRPDHDGGPSVLCVTDTGVGIDAATQARIFDPFFTTKPQDRATGLGLSTVAGIVKEAGGRVEVKSAVGRGSAFTLFLPAA